VRELPHFQRILSLDLFVFTYVNIGIIISIFVTYFLVKRLTFKEKIILYLFNTLFLASLSLSIASLINRNIGENEYIRNIKIDKVEAEFNEMYGKIGKQKSELLATHWRVFFVHKGEKISRALGSQPCEKEIIQRNKCYLKIYNGRLSFELLDNLE